MRDFDRRFGLIGWQGLSGMAVGGIDRGCWDALGRALDQPVVRLLGGVPAGLPAYDSYGIVDPKADEAVIRGSVEAGFPAIKIKLGGGALAAGVAAGGPGRGGSGPAGARG